MQQGTEFLPVSRQEMEARGWDELDFVLVTGDAYVDHPSFGSAIIGRVLEAEGYRVGVLSQPDYTTPESFKALGRPRYGFFIGGGNVDSMVAHYSVAKIRRTVDEYTPGGMAGKRPDRSATVYTRLAKQAYPDLPVILGGLEASLRRFAHYDYWMDTVLPSIAEASGADIISFGMGERQTAAIARRLAAGEKAQTIRDVPGTCYMTDFAGLPERYVECAGFAKVSADRAAYARACRIQMDNQDPVTGQIIVQKQSEKYLVQNPPAKPLNRKELDKVAALPFTRRWHPSYDAVGGVPAIEEVEFSIIHNRGCYGGCNFCAITLHQGRRVTSRSVESVVEEGELLTRQPGFKGYIHDVGGPTANFRLPSCKEQMTKGMCQGGKKCLAPSPCPHLLVDHTEYLSMLRRLRALPGVKKVFIRSGIRYDYLIWDKNDEFFKELVEHHVSGQLKVAPEHCAPNTLKYMGKPPVEVFNKFSARFYELTKKAGKKQYLVPYLMSSHPGSTLNDAVILAEYLYKHKIRPEQVQDFYPTPGTVSTCMFYTGLDPYTMKPVFVEKTPEGKALQRALLQYYEPRNAEKVVRALRKTGREDLIPLLAPAWKPRREKNTPAPRGRNGRQGASAQQGRFTPNSKPPRKGRK
ncbi:MAG TPA: YgiQ family radical SAM protein [Candidatus Fournierella excrementigallinarum]|nr:YgiQ family radical SAM protein [Candidatus Fournierella excrementigallinarum]